MERVGKHSITDLHPRPKPKVSWRKTAKELEGH